MEEVEPKRKKRKKQLLANQEEIEQEDREITELAQALEELEKQGKHVELPICPKCKSPKVRRVKTMGGDLFGHMGIVPPRFECTKCGWSTRMVLKATNKPMTVREVELMAEAAELQDAQDRKNE
ncbi:MAG: hypothetical protein ACE14S_01760 [Candidatus Bathyarchaeia archaeon]